LRSRSSYGLKIKGLPTRTLVPLLNHWVQWKRKKIALRGFFGDRQESPWRYRVAYTPFLERCKLSYNDFRPHVFPLLNAGPELFAVGLRGIDVDVIRPPFDQEMLCGPVTGGSSPNSAKQLRCQFGPTVYAAASVPRWKILQLDFVQIPALLNPAPGVPRHVVIILFRLGPCRDHSTLFCQFLVTRLWTAAHPLRTRPKSLPG